MLDIARRYGLGFGEIRAADPGVDAGVPGEGRRVVLPTQFVHPPRPRTGIVVNLGQMRLFYFPRRQAGAPARVITHPIGIGVDSDATPLGAPKVALFRSLRLLLRSHGRIVTVVSTPEIYVHEWASFSTRAFPENRTARSGEAVRIVMLDVEDNRPVEDIVWSDAAYHEVYQRSGLELLDTYRPLGFPNEPFRWVSETTIAPWAVYVLGASATPPKERTTTT